MYSVYICISLCVQINYFFHVIQTRDKKRRTLNRRRRKKIYMCMLLLLLCFSLEKIIRTDMKIGKKICISERLFAIVFHYWWRNGEILWIEMFKIRMIETLLRWNTSNWIVDKHFLQKRIRCDQFSRKKFTSNKSRASSRIRSFNKPDKSLVCFQRGNDDLNSGNETTPGHVSSVGVPSVLQAQNYEKKQQAF